MLQIRKFICWCYGILSLASAIGLYSDITSLLHPLRPHSRHLFPNVSILLMTMGGGIVFGMAWWTVRFGKRFARAWAIAASILLILLFAPLVLLVPLRSFDLYFGVMIAILLAVGIAGLVVFIPFTDEKAIKPAESPRVVGDGTSRWVDSLVWVFALAGYWINRQWFDNWAAREGLPLDSGIWFWGFFLVAILITSLFHELGHFVVGRFLGMKLSAFVVGPFHWRIRDGRWTFRFEIFKVISGVGMVRLAPTNPHQDLREVICMIAAGPIASLITGVLALGLSFSAKGQPYEQAWQLFYLTSYLSLAAFVINLLPIRPDAMYSDGARIYQLLKGGCWADLYRINSLALSTMVTQLRPRDYDIDAIEHATRFFTSGYQALTLQMHSIACFIDRDEMVKASECLLKAEQICRESDLDLAAEVCGLFSFYNSFLIRNAESARRWWDRMEARKTNFFGVDYWMDKTALLWIESQLCEALAAWETGNTLAHKSPPFGIYDFYRDIYALLQQRISAEAKNGGMVE